MSSEDNPPPTQAQDSPATGIPMVQETESGQKLLQFLQRRLNLPQAMLHRWVRTGQVRINGNRCKPFTRVQTGDMVRLPPFALKMAAESGAPALSPPGGETGPDSARAQLPPPLPVTVGTEGHLWALFKPAGLPTHPGTGHSDSLTTRLALHHPGASFKPTPAHRLDKDTSGILLVAASYKALQEAQSALRDGTLVKEYVAWVRGSWPHSQPRLLRHHLRKEFDQGFEKVRTSDAGREDSREALCLARPLLTWEHESLLLVRLITGRTHQIRVQLASMGHPVIGDAKYGPPHGRGLLLLHALRVTLPGGRSFACLPDWPGRHALQELPPPALPPQTALEDVPELDTGGASPARAMGTAGPRVFSLRRRTDQRA